jgi:hypothetical protein
MLQNRLPEEQSAGYYESGAISPGEGHFDLPIAVSGLTMNAKKNAPVGLLGG